MKSQLLGVGSVMCTLAIERQRGDADEHRHRDRCPSATRVICAFFAFGGLNAGTPFAIASTPVSAVQPDENARSAKNSSAKNASEP